jgi:hypothetical protein
MIRKFTLAFLLFISFQTVVKAQIYDSVSIYIPYGADTTCPGSQLTFTAIQTSSTFTTTTYHWYTDNAFTGVIVDTFYTTALNDGDSVYCKIFYIDGFGFLDSFKSNTIIIHRNDTIPPRVHIAITAGNNPDCTGGSLTFTAFPVNGGTSPLYHWLINSALIPGADSVTFTRSFYAGDTVTCQMISNSTCSAPNNDTVYSFGIPVLHDSLTAGISIIIDRNPICAGTPDTFVATITDPGLGYSVKWYLDSTLVPGALGNVYITDTLHNGDKVYCILTAPDHCVINHTTVSNVITVTVIALLNNSVNVALTRGANPGCLKDSVQFTATFANFGTNPSYIWYYNGVPIDSNKLSIDTNYANGDLITFEVRVTDNGCYVRDTIRFTNILMMRDSTPQTPWISLIGDLLVASDAGYYSWYGPPTGSLIPGAISQTYHPLIIGTYYAIRDTTNCRSDTSNFIYISLLDVNSMSSASQVNIYPNPTTGIVNLDWGTQLVNLKIDVYNIQGQGLIHQEVAGKSHHEMDMSFLPNGNYFVVLRGEDGSKRTFKVVLNK